MDKKAIKTFAVGSRVKLRTGVINKLAKLGITSEAIEEAKKIGNDTIEIPSSGERFTGKDISQRAKLIERLTKHTKQTQKYNVVYEALVEEVAYTWFNRLIAIRFMEVNHYLMERQRFLSSETIGKREPDIITNLLESDLFSEFDFATKAKVRELIADNSASAVDELYQLVFIKQCNSLNEQLPNLFERIDDYKELLFTISYIDENGVIASLLSIPEEAFNVNKGGQVEIIGWMYQYYNTKPKDKVFARGSRKIRSDEIPAATQLFTPDWIVRYMVENSLGRYYINQKLANPTETRTEKEFAQEFGWKYYLSTAEQPEGVQLQIVEERKKKSYFALEDLKIIDPAMGSGHILVYAFDVLMQLYEAEGQSSRTASELILKNNLFGLDIDKRAFQLAYFALMMKGRQFSRRILSKDIKPKIYAVTDNFGMTIDNLQFLHFNFPNKQKAHNDIITLIEGFKEGNSLGSLIQFEGIDFENLKIGLKDGEISFYDDAISQMIHTGELLQQKYDISVTNPPYMGAAGMDKELSTFVKKVYPDSKRDLFGVFIERLAKMTNTTGYFAMITQHAWMFLSSFEKLRHKINHQTLVNMAHLGTRAFEEIGGEVVQTTAFVISPNKMKSFAGSYLRLVDFADYELKEKKALEIISNESPDYLYHTAQDDFDKIPGHPISYWVSENELKIFEDGKLLTDYFTPKTGIQTGDNDVFLRQWNEVDYTHTNIFDDSHVSKYQKVNTGGEAIKWYGNLGYLILWENKGEKIKNHVSSVIRNENYYYLEGISWKRIGSNEMKFKYLPKNLIFDQSGDSMFSISSMPYQFMMAYLNSPVAESILTYIAPTLNLTAGNLSKIPIIEPSDSESIKKVIELVNICIEETKTDFDSFEMSWDFKKHPLL